MAAPDLSGDRWLTITDQDRRGTILVIAIICCVYCPMLLALRAVTSFKNLGLDDYLAIAGKVCIGLWSMEDMLIACYSGDGHNPVCNSLCCCFEWVGRDL